MKWNIIDAEYDAEVVAEPLQPCDDPILEVTGIYKVEFILEDGDQLSDLDGDTDHLLPGSTAVDGNTTYVWDGSQWTLGGPAYDLYDVIVRCNGKFIDDSDVSDDDLELVKGSYLDCLAKVNNGFPIMALLYDHKEADDFVGSETYSLNVRLFHNYGDFVTFTIMGYPNISVYLTESGLSFTEPD